jgi:hypothetical protein
VDDRTIKALQVQAQQRVAVTVEQTVSRLDRIEAVLANLAERFDAVLSGISARLDRVETAQADPPKKASK